MQRIGIEVGVLHPLVVNLVVPLQVPLEQKLAVAHNKNGMHVHVRSHEPIGHPAQRSAVNELVFTDAGDRPTVVARNGKPRAKLVPIRDAGAEFRVPGKKVGGFRVSKSFDAPLPDDLLDAFEGED